MYENVLSKGSETIFTNKAFSDLYQLVHVPKLSSVFRARNYFL